MTTESSNMSRTLREKCPNTALFLVRIFWIDMKYLSVFSPNTGI